MEIIKHPDLVSYLPEENLDGARADLIIRLANGIVTEVTGVLDPIPDRVFSITLEVAARPFRNPSGVQSKTENIDDYTGTERLPDAAARAGVFLTDDEVDRLLGRTTRGSGRGRVGSIRLSVPGYPSC